MLQLGGNAFDAAAAATLASFVTEAGLTSAGGSGFLLAHTQDNQNILFDFFLKRHDEKETKRKSIFIPLMLIMEV